MPGQFTAVARVEGQADLDRRLRRLPRAVREAAVVTLHEGLEQARDWMVAERLSGGPKTGRTTSTRLARRSGNLIASIKVGVEVGAQVVTGRIFQDQRFRAAIYGPVHEHGATIRARRAQYLTIPLVEEAYGVPAPAWKRLGAFAFRSRRGNLLIGLPLGGRRILPLYLLKKSVRIPARPFMAPTAKRFFPRILRQLGAVVREAVQEG